MFEFYVRGCQTISGFVVYSLSTGERLGSCAEYHDIGLTASETDGASFNTDYKGFCEAERDVLSMTDTLYRCAASDNSFFEEPSAP